MTPLSLNAREGVITACVQLLHPLKVRGMVQLVGLKFYVPLDTKWVILETFFLADLLAKKLNSTQQKQTPQKQNSVS